MLSNIRLAIKPLISFRKKMQRGGLRIWWAFLLLAVAVLFAYGLNRGIYVGSSEVEREKSTGVYHYKLCRYLFFSGITVIENGGWDSSQEAAHKRCGLFYDSPWRRPGE
jgi:hypothetical protein